MNRSTNDPRHRAGGHRGEPDPAPRRFTGGFLALVIVIAGLLGTAPVALADLGSDDVSPTVDASGVSESTDPSPSTDPSVDAPVSPAASDEPTDAATDVPGDAPASAGASKAPSTSPADSPTSSTGPRATPKPTRPAAKAAAAAAAGNGCSYATAEPNNGAHSSTICWFDFSGFDEAAARTAGGQPMTVTLDGGYVATFDLKVTDKAGTQSMSIEARSTPLETRFAFGTDAYRGVAGAPALYSRDAPTGVEKAGTVSFANIKVVDSSGAPVTGFSFVAADAEDNVAGESFTWTSNKPLNRIETLAPAGGWGCKAPTGLGTTTLACAGTGTGASTTAGGKSTALLVAADTPAVFSTTWVTSRRSGLVVGIQTAKVTVTKEVTRRWASSDSFDVAVTSPEGSELGTASTGAANSATTGPVTVLPRTDGQKFTLAETATPGSGTDPTKYTQAWACVNKKAGSTTVLPTGTGTSVQVAPATGDDITCTVTNTAIPAPFECATNAPGLLFQGGPTTQYAIDLVTGEYTTTPNISPQNVNATGFNVLDGYVYGVTTTAPFNIVRVGADGNTQVVGPTPGGLGFLIGDVDQNGHYWITNGTTWYEIDLVPGSATYLSVLATGTAPTTSLTGLTIGADWARVPGGGNHLYSVGYQTTSKQAVLVRFNMTTHVWENRGFLGYTPLNTDGNPELSGAMYADADGYFYASYNVSGRIYRIDVDPTGNSTGTLFAQGPSSATNDGARCASSPILIDMGDAPDSYGTLLASDGPRHGIAGYDEDAETARLMLGTTIDPETDGAPGAAADGDGADEDGVTDPIELHADQPTTVTVSATNTTNRPATLVGWIDLNRDGVFGNGAERVIVDVPANSGATDYDLTFPAATSFGDTYARFRLFDGDISDAKALPTGPAAAGEVEDYAVTMAVPPLPSVCTPQQARATERWWYFGDKGGIDFGSSGTAATPLVGTQATQEGSTVVTDVNGQLQFWSNGQQIFNRNGVVMTNGAGLLGNASATQTVAAFPALGQPGKFFVVTTSTDVGAAANGSLSYSVVDMSLSGGLGEVTTKNVSLGAPNTAGEAITAVPNADGTGFWALTFTNNSPNIVAYQFDASGPVGGPVVSVLPSSNYSGYGSLAFSADYSRLVAQTSQFVTPGTGTTPGKVRVLRFNAATGSILQEMEWQLPQTAGSGNLGYNAEFSPDGDYVYATKIFGTGKLYRYKLAGATTGAEVKATEENLGSIGANGGQVRRAPDGRMYVANHLGTSLSVVEDPDAASPNFVAGGWPMPAGTVSRFGLPQMVTGCPPPQNYDFGDAPSSYGTTLADNGPRHAIPGYDAGTKTAPLMLGSSVDAETDGQPGPAANGDGADEDGVSGTLTMVIGKPFEVPVKVTNDTNQPATLAGWVDLNDDGDFDDAGELQFLTVPANSGGTTQTLTWTAPGNPGNGTFMRLRLFPGDLAAGDLSPRGAAAAGEVEDYPVVGPVAVLIECPNIYAMQGSSPFGIYHVEPSTGAMSLVGNMDAGTGTGNNNGMGISADARYVFSHRAGRVYVYDTHTGVTANYPGVAGLNATHGAVNPSTGIYYYGTISGTTAQVYGFDPASSTNLGQVATISLAGAPGGNGDWVFDRNGNFYLTAGANGANILYVVTDPLPTSSGSVSLTGRRITSIDAPAAINGVAFDGAGYLYLGSASVVYQVDPSSGAVVDEATLNGAPGVNSVDLASCASPSTVTLQKDVVERLENDDQFGLSITGGGLTENNTATTVGTDTGVQDNGGEVVGPLLGLPGTEFTIGETGVNADLSDYRATWECVDVSDGDRVVASGNGITGNVTMPTSTGGQGASIVCTITNEPIARDFGDAPNSYGTTLANNGPRHRIDPAVHLGASIDDEPDGQPGPAADGDGADEDGVVFNPALGYPNATLRTGVDPSSLQPVKNTLEVTASADGFVSVWVDWNQDGDFDDAGERVANATPVTAGSNDITFSHGTNPPGIETYVRVRYSTDADAIADPRGAAPDGEVEDYRVLVERLVQPDTCVVTGTEYYAFTFAAPTDQTGTGGVGSTARYRDVTVVDGMAVDMVVEVVAGANSTANGTVNGFLMNNGDDAAWNVNEDATIRYTFYQAGTTTPIDINGVFTVNDMDGYANSTNQQFEIATFNTGDLASYGVSAGSTVTIEETGGTVSFHGHGNNNGDVTSRFQFVLEATSSFETRWRGSANSGFGIDGDGDIGIQPPACDDFGDAPATYGTTLADDGPRHRIITGLLLGSQIDIDPDGRPGPDADGDDTDRTADEDGVADPIAITTGDPVTVTVSVTNDTDQPATLVGWIDLDGDGQFGNGAERVIIDVPANSGTQDYELTFPGGTTTTDTYARFRLFPGDIADADAVPTGAAPGGEVEDYPVTLQKRQLEIAKSSNATADSRPGDEITYTVTATNTGAGDYTAANPARVWDDLSGVLDDATYNDDADADRDGDPVYANPILSWTGPLPAGESVTLTYTVTLKSGGDGRVRNVAFAQCDPADADCDTATPECDPPTGGTDPATGKPCAEEEFGLPKLTITKAADRTELPATGQRATYTVTVTNEGPGDYTAAAPGRVTDDLSDVLDDATIDEASIVADIGTATYAAEELVWEGALAAGETATITYEVTYTGGGDQRLVNKACVPVDEAQDPQDPCRQVQIPGSGLDQVKVATPASGTAVEVGAEITYTLRFANTGQTGATVDTFDDLSGVLDDADLVAGSITADTGLTATYNAGAQRIVITGTVPVDETLEVTYTVRVKRWAQQADHVLRNALQCQPGDGPGCQPDVTEHPVRALDIEKTSNRTADTVIGDTITYTVTAENVGEADYTAADPARVWDDLSGVLDDATYNGDATADPSGAGAITYANPIIEWVGELAQGDAVTLTYTVTLTGAGDLNVRNVAFGACDSTDPACDTTTPVCDPPNANGVDPDTGRPCDEVEFGLPRIEDEKSVDPADRTTVAAGDELTYTLTFTNTGTATGTVSRDDFLGMLLDDAQVTAGPTVQGQGNLTAIRNGDRIEVRGTLGANDTATVTYTVKVKPDAQRKADGGDDMLGNFLIDPDEQPPTECKPEADEDSTCNPVPRIEDEKSVDPADRTSVEAGDELTYTLTFHNEGKGAGQVSRDDFLGMLLDDAEVTAGPTVQGQGNLTATRNGDRIEVRGTLGAGESATVTYTVRVKPDAQRESDGADDMLGNFIIDPGAQPPTECEPEADEDSTCNPVSRIEDEKSVDPADRTSVEAGDELTYTLTFTNEGKGAGQVSRDDFLGMLLDDAEVTAGPTVQGQGNLTATRNGKRIEVRGTLGADESATVTYTVKVKPDAQRVADGGDDMLGNFIIDPGAQPPTECEPEADEDSTCNPVSRIEDEKSVSPADREVVQAGAELTYTLTFTNAGKGAGNVKRDDYLGMLLDDAEVSAGPTVQGQGNLTATRKGDRIEVRGTLGAGESATVTYTVKVKPDAQRKADGGDDMLGNFIIDPGAQPPTECKPAADQDSTCNPVSRIEDSKSVDPKSGTSVKAGQELTYTLTFTNAGEGAGAVDKVDNLGNVLDDATLVSGPKSSAPALTASGPADGRIAIIGSLAAGQTVTVTYTVKVKPAAEQGDGMLGNWLLDPGQQPPEKCETGEDSTCNPISDIVAEKSVDPEDGSTAKAGQELTYTLTFTNTGKGAGEVSYVDDMRGVLDDTDLVKDPQASVPGLAVSLDKGRLAITGELTGGQTATVTYTVKVKAYDDQGDHRLANFLHVSGTSLMTCEKGNPMCTTNPIEPPVDSTPEEPTPEEPDNPLLPNTGGPALVALLAGLALLVGGGLVLSRSRRGRGAAD